MLGYVRPAGGPENTLNIEEILTQIFWCDPLDPNSLHEWFVLKLFMAHLRL